MSLIRPWTGHRLVYMGESPIGYYPLWMLSEDEREELATGGDGDEYEVDQRIPLTPN